MRRLVRTDTGIDYVKLFAAHARQNGLAQYDTEAIAAFGDEVQRSISTSARTESRLRGLRRRSSLRLGRRVHWKRSSHSRRRRRGGVLFRRRALSS